MFGLSFGRDTGRDFVSFSPVSIVDGGGWGVIGIGNEFRKMIGGDNAMTAG